MKALKILFFINDSTPTDAQVLEAMDYGNNVGFRNANFIHADDKAEDCDGVAGEVPKPYAKFPKAKEAIEIAKKELKEKMKALGEKPAPQIPDANANAGANGGQNVQNWNAGANGNKQQ